MDEENQIDNKLQRKRELTNARVKNYRKRKRMESQQLNSSMQDDPNEEMESMRVQEKIAEWKKAMAKERSRRYREKKHLNALQSVHDSQTLGPMHGNPSLVLKNQQTTIHNSQIAGTSTNMDIPLVTRENQRTTIHDSQIAGTSTNMNIPLVIRNDYENSNIGENISSPLNEENQPIDIDDNLAPLQVQVRIPPTPNVQFNRSSATYSAYARHSSAHKQFHKQFIQNEFGYICIICDRLWFKGDLKKLNDESIEFIRTFFPNVDVHSNAVCSTCRISIQKKTIPTMAVYNGFRYPTIPENLRNCPLDLVSERLISPRIPFMQIRRLHHVHGQYGIFEQIINVPVEVNTMVNKLPRNINNDHCIYVHIKRKKYTNRVLYTASLINAPSKNGYNIR